MGLPASLANSPDLNSSDATLIWELVSDINPAKEVLARHGMTPNDLQKKTRNPMFRSAYQEARRLWSSELNVQERIKLKAAYLLEDSLPDLFKIIKDDSQPGSAKMIAIEQLGKLSQVMAQKKEGGGERHSITINVGNATPVVIEHTVPAIEGEVA
jgi:hypothetical protein